MKKYTLLVILILVITVTFCLLFNKKKIEKNDILNFGTCADYSPMEYYSDGELTGFEIELAQIISEKLKIKIVFEDMAFGSLQVALEKGFIDAFIASVGVTPDGKEKFDFSIPYYLEKMVFLYKKNSPIVNKEQLSKKKIIYQLSGRIKKCLEENLPEAKLMSTDRLDLAVELLIGEHVECVFIDIFVAQVYCQKNPELSYFVLDSLKISDGIAIAFNKGSPLKEKINEILKYLESTGKLQELREKWELKEEWKLANE